MLTSLAVVLIGIWLIVQSQGPVNATITLIFGIVAAALAVADLVGVRLP